MIQIIAVSILVGFSTGAYANSAQCETALSRLKQECEAPLKHVQTKLLKKKSDGSHADGQVKEFRNTSEKLTAVAADCQKEKSKFDEACDPSQASSPEEAAKMKSLVNQGAGVAAQVQQKKMAMEKAIATTRREELKAKSKKK